MGPANTIPEATDQPDACLSADELTAALTALSVADKLKLASIERVRRGGTRFKRGELLHEAFCLSLIGRRKCPRGVPLVAFLAQTMRSIAFHDRKRHETFLPLHVVPRDGGASSEASTINKAVDAVAVEEASRVERSKETVEAILNLFGDDEEAQLVLIAWSEGCRGAELREATGLNQDQVDYAAKRIRGKMRKLYPNGWAG